MRSEANAPLFANLTDEAQQRLYAWLCLAIASLVGAGLFAILVALGRTPGFQTLLPGGDYFQRALVGHVNLAFVIWFLAFQGTLWSLINNSPSSSISWIGFWTAASGAGILVIPALLGWGEPVLSNYVPELTHPLFVFGQVLFMGGIGLSAVYTLRTTFRLPKPLSLAAYGSGITAALVLISLLCFVIAPTGLTPRLPPQAFFEKLAWGGGHLLQFANTAAMTLVWLILLSITTGAADLPPILKEKWTKRFLLFFLIMALPAPFFYLSKDPSRLFTLLMSVGLGPVTGLLGVTIVWILFFRRRSSSRLPAGDPGFSGLILSVALFGLGGLIASRIRGNNVIVPAHYHAVIGGVTLAFMGFSYHLLPLVGRKVWSLKLAQFQPYLYGIGQTLFVLGLAWAGAHGVPRKTFGGSQGLTNPGQYLGMSLMGLGGLIAISGGMAFIGNLIPSLASRAKPISPGQGLDPKSGNKTGGE